MRKTFVLPLAFLGALALSTAAVGKEPAQRGDVEHGTNFQIGDVEYRLEMDFPDRDDVLRALPPVKHEREIDDIVCELISTDRGNVRSFPVGGGRAIRAYIVSSSWRCTVYSDQGVEEALIDFDSVVAVE